MNKLSPLQLKLQAKLAALRKESNVVEATKATITEIQAQSETNAVSEAGEQNKKSLTVAEIVQRALASGGSLAQASEGTAGGLMTAEIPATILPATTTDKFGNAIVYNTNQKRAVDLIASGQSCVVIGAAGTGKTTIQKGSTAALIQSGLVSPLQFTDQHKHLVKGAPGIIICAYTRRATNNIRRNMSEDLQACCMTIHKALEYEPVEVYITDADGNEKRSMRFEPTRNAENPLPSSIHTVIIEEASMVSVELFRELEAALPHKPQYVFLGDIQQLPPVFGSAILGFKMLELPVVELTEVYRQALESPILSLAHRILSGKGIPAEEFAQLNRPHKLTLHAWKKRIEADSATETLAKFFLRRIDEKLYDPETDAILIPFNKACGTDELNKHLATKLARNRFAAVYEIIHGWKKSWYSVGDKCLYDKEDAIILAIEPNSRYVGVMPQEASHDLDYWGNGGAGQNHDDIDAFLDAVSVGKDDGEKKMRAASHVIKLKLLDSDREISIQSAGEIDALTLGYAITIHKSQGSEWSRVYLCLHHTHSVMVARELLYTAVTRAKEELFCICEADSLVKGITRQRIKGNTWQEKAHHFKGKLENEELQS